SGFLYVGRPSCEHCQAFSPLLNKAIKNVKASDVYYYNIDDATAADQNAMNQILSQLNVTGTPTFMFMKDGQEHARLSDTTDESAIETFLKKYQ
ncbi:MAG: thioredoxin family protein, partial [Candidatus Nomurabacteria bacterium]|nr:thioredoxin family protein [Candidatus Nomurabacteria bacterium]